MVKNIESFITYIVKSLVEDQETVSISNDKKDGFNKIQIQVAKNDMGRIIGRAGNRIKAIQLIASAFCSAEQQKVKVTLIE